MVTAATKRKLRVLARAHQRKKRSAQLPAASTNLRPGTVISKQWRGAQHVVIVLGDGFQHQGKVYGSLSHVAREITGTRWNGPAFFGLRQGHGRTAEVGNDANKAAIRWCAVYTRKSSEEGDFAT